MFMTQAGDVLTEQFAQGVQKADVSGEKALMRAVLDDGIRCFQAQPRNPRLCMEDEAWILSADDSWLFSFNNVCRHLGIDSTALRSALRAWKKQHLGSAT